MILTWVSFGAFLLEWSACRLPCPAEPKEGAFRESNKKGKRRSPPTQDTTIMGLRRIWHPQNGSCLFCLPLTNIATNRGSELACQKTHFQPSFNFCRAGGVRTYPSRNPLEVTSAQICIRNVTNWSFKGGPAPKSSSNPPKFCIIEHFLRWIWRIFWKPTFPRSLRKVEFASQ